MSFDLLLKGGVLPDGTQADIAITDGKIAAVEANISAEAGETIDVSGQLVSPPFVDPHFHLDATLSYGTPRINASGTLLEGIALWSELKPIQTVEEIEKRAIDYCDWAASMGLLAIRTHVDTSDEDGMKGVEALLSVRDKVKDYVDLQLVAFPQDGLYRAPAAKDCTIRALDMGVDVVGGIPHFERTMEDGRRSVTELCEIAEKRGLMVDLHCDESDDPLSRHIEQLVYETQRLGLQGRVAGSHLTSMHSMDNYYVSKLLPLMAEAQVAAISDDESRRHDALLQHGDAGERRDHGARRLRAQKGRDGQPRGARRRRTGRGGAPARPAAARRRQGQGDRTAGEIADDAVDSGTSGVSRPAVLSLPVAVDQKDRADQKDSADQKDKADQKSMLNLRMSANDKPYWSLEPSAVIGESPASPCRRLQVALLSAAQLSLKS